MEKFNLEDHPHRRYNALTGEWILVSPHRAKRPWQGQVEKKADQRRPVYDPKCYLCPGNERAGGMVNPKYDSTFVFTNDFSALLSDSPTGEINDHELFQAKSDHGICKVICFSPNHDLTIPEMDVSDIKKVVDIWCEEYAELGNNPNINYVQIFENKGAVMGCSNPHPHGQIWSSFVIPSEVDKEIKTQKEYYKKHNKTLLSEYIDQEKKQKSRILFENDHFIVLVPFWAVWPFEAMIIPSRPVQNILLLNSDEKVSLADAYKRLTIMYDNLFETSFPYSAGIHQSPTDGDDHPEWHLHMHFYPPLLRSATVKKFMVGYEMLASPQRDITAESAALRLKELPKTHFTKI